MPFQPRLHNIDYGVLRNHFHMPMALVAEKFSMCLTFFKKVCRQHGIKRWPYRKVRSLEKRIVELQERKDDASAANLRSLTTELSQLTGQRTDESYTSQQDVYRKMEPDDGLGEEEEDIEEGESRSTKRRRLEDVEDVNEELARDTEAENWSDGGLVAEGSGLMKNQSHSSEHKVSGSHRSLENRGENRDELIELLERDEELQDGNASVSWDDLWQSCQKDFQNDNAAVKSE